MTRYVGIDYSTTSCGVAVVDDGHWQVSTLRSKPTGDTLAAYYERIADLATDIVMLLQPDDVVALEGIAFAGRGRAVDRLHYAWHRTVEVLLDHLSAAPVIVTTNQVKQLATGRGSAQKDDVLLATERRIPEAAVRNNDEADAVWIAVGVSVLAGDPVVSLPAAHMPKAFARGATA